MKVAIIPARQGSKRIPRKNVKEFCGHPLISYSISAALKAQLFDHVIVSTDSDEISEIAKECGASVPFLRPSSLADDHTPTAAVLEHALKWVAENLCMPDYACCIYATAPFLSPLYIKEGLSRIAERGVASAFSVSTYEFPVFRSLRLNESGCVEMMWPEYEMVRSQDLPEAYHDAGQFYWVNAEKFLQNPKLYTADAVPVILPRYLVQDIDTLEDWTRAELMYDLGRAKGLI